MMDWLGKMLKLPEDFLAGTKGKGGGVIQVSMLLIIEQCNVKGAAKVFYTVSGGIKSSISGSDTVRPSNYVSSVHLSARIRQLAL